MFPERTRRHARRRRKSLVGARPRARRKERKAVIYSRKQYKYVRKSLVGARPRARRKARKPARLRKEPAQVSKEISVRSAPTGAQEQKESSTSIQGSTTSIEQQTFWEPESAPVAHLSKVTKQVSKEILGPSACVGMHEDKESSSPLQENKKGIEGNPFSERAHGRAGRQRKQHTYPRKEQRYRWKSFLGARPRARGKGRKAAHRCKETGGIEGNPVSERAHGRAGSQRKHHAYSTRRRTGRQGRQHKYQTKSLLGARPWVRRKAWKLTHLCKETEQLSSEIPSRSAPVGAQESMETNTLM